MIQYESQDFVLVHIPAKTAADAFLEAKQLLLRAGKTKDFKHFNFCRARTIYTGEWEVVWKVERCPSG